MIIRTVSLLVVRGRRKGSGAADSFGARRNVKQTGGAGGQGGGGRRCSSCGRGRGSGSAEAAAEEEEKLRRRRIRRMRLRAEREAADGRCPAKVVEWLRRHTHFDRREIECLWRAHWRLAASEAPPSISNASPFGAATPLLDRHTFRHLMHTALGITDDAILERLFAAFAGGTGTTGASASSSGGGGGNEGGGGGGGWTNTGEDGGGSAAQGGGNQSPPPPTHAPGASGGIDARRWVLSLSVLLRGTPQEKRALCFHAYDLNGDGVLSRDEVARLLRHSLALGRRRSSSPSSGGGGAAAANVQRGRKGEGGEGGKEEDRGEEEAAKVESSGGGGRGVGGSRAGGGGGGRARAAGDDEDEEEGEESVKELAEVALARLDVDGDGKVSAEDFERAVAAEPLLLEALGPCLPEREAAQAFMEYIVTCAGT